MKLLPVIRASLLVSAVALLPATTAGLAAVDGRSGAQFNRLMNAITAWVAPQEGDNAGCAYCHNVENMASDELYTKVVARLMHHLALASIVNCDVVVAVSFSFCLTAARRR